MTQVRRETTQHQEDQASVKEPTPKSTFWESRLILWFTQSWVLWIFAVLVALALNLWDLGKPSIWFDEAFSVELARQPLPLLWHIIFGPEPNMELYYLLLHFWLQVTGWAGLNPVEWVVRLPSVICAALSAGIVFLIGRRYLGKVASGVATLLYALNYLQLIYAQQTRSYALQLCLICISWLALLLAFNAEQRAWRWWTLYILATVLAVYAHLFSALVLLAQVVAIAGIWFIPGRWSFQVRRYALIFIGCLVAISLLSVPMLIESRQGAKTGWLFVPHLHELLSLFVILSGDNKIYLVIVGGSACLGLLVACTALLRKLSRRGQHLFTGYSWIERQVRNREGLAPFTWSLLCWFVIPIVVSYIISQGSLRLFSTRYLVVVVPPFCLLAGVGVAVMRRRIVQVVWICILLGIALRVTPHYYQNAQVESWRPAVQWMQARYQSGDGLVCYDNELTQGCQIAVEYYLHAYPNGTSFSADSPGTFSWQNYGPADPQQGYQAALDTHILMQYGQRHARIFFIVGRVPDAAGAAQVKRTEQWLDAHDHFESQIVTSTVTIRLYETH